MNNLSSLINVDPNFFYKQLGMKVPINPMTIAKNLDIDIETEPDLDRMGYSGEVFIRDGKAVIWVNGLEPIERQRFTVAHELGHLFLHMLQKEGDSQGFRDGASNFKRNKLWDGIEYEANNFAARLLMPRFEVLNIANDIIQQFNEQYGRKAKMTTESFISRMAKRFEVSFQAMKNRLTYMKMIPI